VFPKILQKSIPPTEYGREFKGVPMLYPNRIPTEE
jgi:hypothetical protein